MIQYSALINIAIAFIACTVILTGTSSMIPVYIIIGSLAISGIIIIYCKREMKKIDKEIEELMKKLIKEREEYFNDYK